VKSLYSLFSSLKLVCWLALTLAACCWNWRQVFVGGEVYFVDPDCYARMNRVQQAMSAPWRAISFHDFENAPSGARAHTTAPTDLLVIALAASLELVSRITGFPRSASTLDLAGAFLSPLLGMALVAFLWWWGRKLTLPHRSAMLTIVAVSPILAHGFQLGRPDHQSLIILLVGAALAVEIRLWKEPLHRWEVFSAALWALAFWTSLFEPLILLAATAIMRVAVRRSKALPDWRAIAVFVSLLGGALLFDGWRVRSLSSEERSYFLSWALNIGELRRGTLPQLFCWTGWLLTLSPALLFWRSWRERSRAYAMLAGLLLLLTAFSLWHVRWGYFLAIVFALSIPFALAALRGKLVAWIVFAISLWPMAEEWDRQLFPNKDLRIAREEDRWDASSLREASQALISPARTIILAPWWLSPAVAYWSGQRCVGGSSHQSLPGIVDSSRFYLSTDPEEARAILRKRSVNYVIAYEPARVISNSAQILKRPLPKEPLGERLYNAPHACPSFLRLVYENRFSKVFEFVDKP
jgi:hypothetical protein